MKLNPIERLLINSNLRAVVQRRYEGPLLRRLGGAASGASALEIGCGRGTGIDVILQQFEVARVCGIDLDPLQIERARKRLHAKHHERVTLMCGDAERLPFADTSFDAVFDFGVLHHLPDWQSGIAEVRRVLKPGGTFFFEEVTRAALERWIYRRSFRHPAANRFSEAEFLEEVSSRGMKPAGAVQRTLFGDIFIGAVTVI
jgi:ubiquinone/menaquinone biosynthesis C-methylase UbiE